MQKILTSECAFEAVFVTAESVRWFYSQAERFENFLQAESKICIP